VEGSGTEFLLLSGEAKLHDDCFLFSILSILVRREFAPDTPLVPCPAPHLRPSASSAVKIIRETWAGARRAGDACVAPTKAPGNDRASEQTVAAERITIGYRNMTTAELIELSDLNYAEAMRELSRRGGGVVQDEGGVMLYAGPHPMPVLSNGVMRTTRDVPAAEVLERASAFFARHARGYSVVIGTHRDEDLRAAATAAGLVQLGDTPGMVLDHRLPDTAPPAHVTLRRVESAADRDGFADVMEAAYGTYGMPPGVTPVMFARLETLIAPHIVSFLAFIDARPVAGAMVLVTHGVAGIYWVGTIPDARGHGLAELCTRAAGNAGFDLGARIAALQASPMGEPIYRRMGYVEVTRYPYLVRFKPPAE
jgi:hypothetical protein